MIPGRIHPAPEGHFAPPPDPSRRGLLCRVAALGRGALALSNVRADDGLTKNLPPKRGAGAWGAVAMPPQPQVEEADARALVQWILAGAK